MADPTVVGVDIGGTHITAALVDSKSGAVRTETLTRAQLQPNGEKAEIISSWARTIKAAAVAAAPEALRIGIAMPGPFDYEKGVSLMKFQEKYDALYGLDVKALLAAELQIQPEQIRFMNGAACFLRGETIGGAAKGAACAIGLTLGTGLGSALYMDSLAADAALWCSPFKDGIAEDYMSARWFTKRYLDLTGLEVPHVQALAELLPEYPLVQDIFEEFGQLLGEFLAIQLQVVRAEVVVVGGNVSQALTLFLPQVQQTLFEHAFSVPVRQAQLGEAAALLGAATLWEAP